VRGGQTPRRTTSQGSVSCGAEPSGGSRGHRPEVEGDALCLRIQETEAVVVPAQLFDEVVLGFAKVGGPHVHAKHGAGGELFIHEHSVTLIL
jgi:hypothetical protein